MGGSFKLLMATAAIVWLGITPAGAATEVEPAPEWHRVLYDTVAQYNHAVYSINGRVLGHNIGLVELHKGEVYLVRATPVGRGYEAPLYGATAWVWTPDGPIGAHSEAFDPRPAPCTAKKVLLHYEITCTDQ